MLAALLLLVAADDDHAVRARASEEAAFAAVGEKRWCEALSLFLEADGLAPSPDLIFNAAQAAELGSDRARAMQLYTQLLGTTTSAERKSEAKQRIAALTKLVEQAGPGVPCALPAAAAPMDTATATATTLAATPLPREPTAPPTPAAPAPPSPWPWATGAAGVAAVVAGGAIVFVGLRPWFAHASARDALVAAEKQGTTDGVAELAEQQERARAQWQGFGQAAVAAGIAFAAVGLIAAVGGAAWGVTAGGPE